MSSLSQALGYLSEVTKFASQGPISYGMGECVCMVRPYTVIAGMLSKADTDKLVDDYCNVHGGQLDGYGRVPVAISLRTLVYEDPRRPAKGLLLLPAMLDINGRLSMDAGTQRPWIPLERLSAPGSAPRTVTVATLADYRHFQIEHQAEFADPVTWGVYVDLALAMFDTICHVDQSGLDDSNCRVDSELCRIKCVPMKEPTLTASSVFSYLANHPEASLPRTISPYFGEKGELDEDSAPTLTISRTELKQAEQEREAQAPKASEEASESAKEPNANAPALPAAHDDEALGTPTEPTSLRAIDRLMENAKLRRGSCVANQRLSTEAYDVLRLLCSNNDDALSCLRLPLGSDALDLACALAATRVTDCAVRGEEEPYILFAVSSEVFRRRVLLALDSAYGTQEASHSGSSPVLGPWLARNLRSRERSRSIRAFLEHAGVFLGHAPATPEAAARILAERLRRIDQLRCELIDGYTEVRTASDLARQQEERLLALARLRDEHAHAKARLDFWNGLAEQGRAHRALGRGRGGQRDALQKGAEEGETFALESKTLDEVVQKYQELVSKQESKLDSTRRETAKLELRVRRHSLSGTKGAEDVAVLADLCKLDRAGKRELDSLFAGGELTAEKLDRVLDRTVRPCEFWLAVHLYEARELQRTTVRPMPRWHTVATIYEIPGLVGKFAGKPPIDTLLCLRAERMRTPQALSCLALSRRAIVMGDPTGIGPRWELDAQADGDISRLAMDSDGWDFVRAHELGASAPQRFLTATQIACEKLPRTFYQLHGLNPSRGAIARYRSRAFYGGAGKGTAEGGVSSLYLMAEGSSEAEHVGDSLRNLPEAQRIVQWIESIAPRVRERHEGVTRPICVLTPYTSQAQLVRDLLNSTNIELSRTVGVQTVRQASGQALPVVVFSAVTSVEALNEDFTFGVDSLLSVCSAMATDCFAVFCNEAWKQVDVSRSVAVGCLVEEASIWSDPTEPVLPVALSDASTAIQSDAADAAAQTSDTEGTDTRATTEEEDSPLPHPSESKWEDENSPGAKNEPSDDSPAIQPAQEPTDTDQTSSAPSDTSTVHATAQAEEEPAQGSAPEDAASPNSQQREAPQTTEEQQPFDPSEDGIDAAEKPSRDQEAKAPIAGGDPAPTEQPAQKKPKVFATLSQVLHELQVAGMIATEPEADMCFRWLQRDGYVRVSSARDGSIGWVPTQRGVRCGMYPQQADDGSLWCGFSDGAAEYVLASVQLHSKNR